MTMQLSTTVWKRDGFELLSKMDMKISVLEE
jgi:hypothetical protein